MSIRIWKISWFLEYLLSIWLFILIYILNYDVCDLDLVLLVGCVYWVGCYFFFLKCGYILLMIFIVIFNYNNLF